MASNVVRIVVLAIAASLGTAFAQGEATLNAAFSVGKGRFLVDGQGRAVYAFLPDRQGVSACTGSCAETWPPLVTSGGVSVGDSLDVNLVGAVSREDGVSQVTYGGWPLYTYIGDEAPGSTAGQRANDAWFLVAPDGALVGADDTMAASESAAAPDDAAEPARTPAAAADDGQMNAGRRIYEQSASPACATCHAVDGTGGAGPSLIGASRLSNPPRAVAQIVNGGHMMPGYGEQLSDAEIAAVLTYIANSWGNESGPLAAQEVSNLR